MTDERWIETLQNCGRRDLVSIGCSSRPVRLFGIEDPRLSIGEAEFKSLTGYYVYRYVSERNV